MDSQIPPEFFLYGEPSRAADPQFVHVEDLALRSRPGNWRIAPHMHGDLNHLIVIREGAGTIEFETEVLDFAAPVLLAVPARCVHGFTWQRESAGQVLTIADLQLHQLGSAHPDLLPLFAMPRCLPLSATELAALDEALALIAREANWVGLGQSAALQAGLLLALVHAARRMQQVHQAAAEVPRQLGLVARFRQLVEQRYRLREPVSAYARALGVSETVLREACAATGQTPSAIRDLRTIVEAQRMLAFSAMTIAEVGAAVGITDPAYFSRFFTRNCGTSPARWREAARRRKRAA